MASSRNKPRARTAIEERKESHLTLCAGEAVEYTGKTTLFEEVELIHDALPELSLDEIDLSETFLGKTLRAPLVIAGMTGGTEQAYRVNRDLAALAEEYGLGFGLGSQRAMAVDSSKAWTYQVRSVAPSTVILANIGLTQAARHSEEEIEALVSAVGADGLCVHLNPAQELVQPEGDRDFRGGLATFARLANRCSVPVIAKETGCGISPFVAQRLTAVGVRFIDISGAGGTSWVKVETLRSNGHLQRLGQTFATWGIPTAAALRSLRESTAHLIASGGVRTGLDMAKAIALGARICGAALPVFRAYRAHGKKGAAALIEDLILSLKTAMLLSGARTLAELRNKPVVIGPKLAAWETALRSSV